jgi:hypothetical protein
MTQEKFTNVFESSEWGRISSTRPRTSTYPVLPKPSDQDWVKGFCGGILVASIVWGTIVGALLWH